MWLRTLLARAIDPFRRSHRDARLDAEVQAHLDLLTDDYVAQGYSRDDAELAARRAFGNADALKQDYRERRGIAGLDAAMQDVRFALRLLRRDAGFTLAAVLVLGLGLGVNHMFLTIVYAHTMRGVPAVDAGRLVSLSTYTDSTPNQDFSFPEFFDLRASTRTLQSVVAYTTAPVTLGEEDRAADRFDGSHVSAGAFALVGARPLLGRDFTADDHRVGATPVVLIGRTVWRARYGEDPAVLGRTVLVNGTAASLVGVVPDASGFPSTAAVWLPLEHAADTAGPASSARNLQVLGRLRDGTSLEDARAEIQTMMTAFAAEEPAPGRDVRARVVTINERLFLPIEGAWLAFLLAGCIIILISCANVGNLILAHGLHRAREVAIRTSLGASRWRIVRQRLVEALLIAAAGAVIGLAVSRVGNRIFSNAIPAGTLPYWIDYSLDSRVFLALLLVAAGSAAAFGLVPAPLAARTDANAVLKDGGRALTGRRRSGPWMQGLLAVQVALAIVLLATITVGNLSQQVVLPTDQPIQRLEAITASITLPAARYATADSRVRFLEQLLDRVDNVPGVDAASVATFLPVAGGPLRTLEIESMTWPGDTPPSVRTVDIGTRYFETLSLAIRRGTDVTTSGALDALVNDTFVERFFPNSNALGRRIAVQPLNAVDSPAWYTIVGIVPDVRQQDRGGAQPVVYRALSADPPPTFNLIVRSRMDPAAMTASLRTVIHALDRDVPLYQVRSLRQAIRDAGWNSRVSARLSSTLMFLSIVLAGVGLYAVTAHGVSTRRHEFGIRLALGATAWRIASLVLRDLRVALGLGLVLGIGGAVAWDRAFPSGRPDLSVSSPEVLAATVMAVALITFVACAQPTRRAVRLDPAAVLRDE